MSPTYMNKHSFDKTLETYIEYPTCSDAMLASLALVSGVDCTIMDAVLSIVRHPSFNPSEVTLRNTEDVYAHVAKRRSQKSIQLTANGLESGLSLVPRVIVDGVIDAVGDEVQKLSRTFVSGLPHWHGQNTEKAATLRQDLLNMCLVQRSWVQPARRALGRSLSMSNPSKDDLMHPIRNPFLGPWTRDLTIEVLDAEEGAGVVKKLRTFVSARLPALLSMSLTVRHQDLPLVTDILGLLPLLKELKLRVEYSDGECPPIPLSFFSTFALLHSLEHLTLDLPHWSPSEIPAYRLPSEFSFVKQTPRLRSVHLHDVAPNQRLSWTRLSDGGFSLRTLERDFGCASKELRDGSATYLRPFTKLLSPLENLRVQVPEIGNIALPRMLKYCSNIRRLHFEADEFPSEEVLRSIPSSIERLEFRFTVDFRLYPTTESEPWDELQDRLLHYLSSGRCSYLQKLRVFMHSKHEGSLLRSPQGVYHFRVLDDIRLRRVEMDCEKRGIEFRFTTKMDEWQGWLV